MRLWLAVMVMAANGPSPVNDTVDDIFASLEKKKKKTHLCVFRYLTYSTGGGLFGKLLWW